MRVRGIAAVANSKLLELARSPITLIVLAAFLLLVASLPDPGSASRADRVRQAAAWMVSAASALLWVTAVLVPVSGGSGARRAREGSVLGCRRTNLGHAAASLAFLVFLAGILALVSWTWISSKFGNPDVRAGGPVVRSLVWRNPAPFKLHAGEAWTSPAIAIGRQGGSIEVELAPSVRFVEDLTPASAPASGPSSASLEISWRVDGDRVRTRRVAMTGAPVVQTLELAPEARAVVLGLRLSGRALELDLAPGALSVVGARTGLFPVLARALLVIACLASVVAAITQWFSGFVGPSIAVSAALTVAIAFAAVRAMEPAFLSGVPDLLPLDPVAALRRGHETGWPEVLRAGAASAVAILVGSVAALRGPERRGT